MLSAVTNGAHIFFFLSIGKIAVDDQKFAVSVFRDKIKKKKKSCFGVSVFRCFGVSLFRGLARSIRFQLKFRKPHKYMHSQ